MEKIKKDTVVKLAMDRIKDLISSGEYKVGDRLPTENEFAEKFGIGRSSLREAIKIFNYLGVLESFPSKGTYVCDKSQISTEALSWAVLLGGNELEEIIEIRAAIELWSVMKLTKLYKDNKKQYQPYIYKLEETVNKMKVEIQNHSIENTNLLDFQFHDIVISSSNNSIFISIYHTLESFMLKSATAIHRDIEISKALPIIHESLIEAIKSGSREEVIEEMHRHINITKDKLYINYSNANISTENSR